MNVTPMTWFRVIGSLRQTIEKPANASSVATPWIALNRAVVEAALPLRLAGRARQYSTKAD